MDYNPIILHLDCNDIFNPDFRKKYGYIQTSFLDPPFNQGKEYDSVDDDLLPEEYWNNIDVLIEKVYENTADGGSIFLMHREKNLKEILQIYEKNKITLQNIIIWKKRVGSFPQKFRLGKRYQIIVWGTKGDRPTHFNHLRIDPKPPKNFKEKRENGVIVEDMWDDEGVRNEWLYDEGELGDFWEDILELTAGYFSKDEPLRDKNGKKLHYQQMPISLALRIVLMSTHIGDLVFDAFSGSGTMPVVCNQLKRKCIATEISSNHIQLIHDRISMNRKADKIDAYYKYYKYTRTINEIWKKSSSDLMDFE